MKILKKMLVFIMITVIITATLIDNTQNNIYANSTVTEGEPVKVAVFIFNFTDPYLSLIKQNLEDIEKENENKVKFTFFDAKGNQSIQNESINKALNEDFDLLILNLVDIKLSSIQDTLNRIISKNIPVIFASEPKEDLINFIKPYKRAVFIGTDLEQSGELEGKILVDIWNTDKSSIDKNNDNVMQYVMLYGKIGNPISEARTKYSVLAINNSGIKTEQLALKVAEWDEELAKSAIESLFLNYGEKIEAIIANNDAMAIGAIEALQKYGYNKNDKSKYIHVVGIDAIPEAQELIKKGYMTGSVFQDPRLAAEAFYTVGMNLVANKYPLDGTDYQFDSTGVMVRLPYFEYNPKSENNAK